MGEEPATQVNGNSNIAFCLLTILDAVEEVVYKHAYRNSDQEASNGQYQMLLSKPSAGS